jgi:hypothetical protein
MMGQTAYPYINTLLGNILTQMQSILGTKLVGLYLYGSLVTRDFDSDISDIDLLAATTSDMDDHEFSLLKAMHDDIVSRDPQWEERIEIAYLSLHALKTFRTETSKIAIISPGEPFHFKDAGKDWLMNWYMVREKGATLYGPAPTAIIEPISKVEFVQAVKAHVREWGEWVDHMRSRPAQAYVTLTMCRALYTMRNGEQVSKIQAAEWAAQELPNWSSLIRDALVWRQNARDEGMDHDETFLETRQFVDFIRHLILS